MMQDVLFAVHDPDCSEAPDPVNPQTQVTLPSPAVPPQLWGIGGPAVPVIVWPG
jgi:hypothetical protein